MYDEIMKLLEEKQFNKARNEVLNNNEAYIAEIIEDAIKEVSIEKTIILFRMLPKDISAEVFSFLSNDTKLEIINGITDKEIQYIVDELFFDDMIDLLEELPANVVKKILSRTEKEKRKLINQFLKYPVDSAGSLMTIEYTDLKKEMTVKEAIGYLKEHGISKETIYTCYVMDAGRRLEGIVPLRQLIISEDDTILKDIMDTDVISVNAYDDQEEIAKVFMKYDFIALPVVDKENRLVGIITIDDIIDVIEQENTEDFHRMAAIMPSEKQYLGSSAFFLARQRIPWLLVLMFSSIITGSIIGKFQLVLSQVIALVTFLPMVMGTGGNAGAQSSTLVIRGMAVGDIELSDILRVIWKEVKVSAIVGIFLSLFNFVRIYVVGNGSLLLAITVSLSLFLVVLSAKVIGGTLPIIAKKAGIDPAIMANPFIASLTDMISVTIYFILATILLGIG